MCDRFFVDFDPKWAQITPWSPTLPRSYHLCYLSYLKLWMVKYVTSNFQKRAWTEKSMNFGKLFRNRWFDDQQNLCKKSANYVFEMDASILTHYFLNTQFLLYLLKKQFFETFFTETFLTQFIPYNFFLTNFWTQIFLTQILSTQYFKK